MTLIQPRIGAGNIKLGPIPNFSLPSGITCPGASEWCRKHCYAARFERIRPNCGRAYSQNLLLSWDPPRFVREMLDWLHPRQRYLRIHVSGDFHSVAYIEAWVRIARRRRRTQFWAYTRSWTDPELRVALESLRALPNVHLFASLDPGMPDPPQGWRVAYLDIDSRATGVACLHQTGKARSCFECGYCFRPGSGHVIFSVH